MSDECSPGKGTRLTAVEIHDSILEPAREEMRRRTCFAPLEGRPGPLRMG